MAARLSAAFAVVEPDQREWDGLVDSHPQGNLLQTSAWASLKNQFGWQVKRIAVRDQAGLRAGAQLLIRRKFGLSMGYVPRGPLFSGDPEIDGLLLQALHRSLRGARCVFLRIEPNLHEDEQGDELHTFLQLQNWRTTETIQPRSTIELDISKSSDQLFAAFSKGHRADIRRSERLGVSVRVGTSEADLDAFYAAMEATTDRKSDYAIHSRDYYDQAWQIFKAQGRAQLLIAEFEGQAVGSCMVFASKQSGFYLYGGSNEVGLKKGANHLLQWNALQWAQAQGCQSYDFWGIPDAFGRAAFVGDEARRAELEAQAQQDPLYGVYRFKKGFGGQVVRFLPAYDFVYLAPLYELWKRRAA
jgi:lipid II:glycine glycyltransferase (peptidoglycan interpeptide bridge formation enzyme)